MKNVSCPFPHIQLPLKGQNVCFPSLIATLLATCTYAMHMSSPSTCKCALIVNILLHMYHSLREDDNLDTTNEEEDKHGASHVAPKASVHLLGILQCWRKRKGKLYRGTGSSVGNSEALPAKGRHLSLQLRFLESEQEAFDMILAQLVNASSINGTTQKLIHLIFRIQGFLCTSAAGEEIPGW